MFAAITFAILFLPFFEIRKLKVLNCRVGHGVSFPLPLLVYFDKWFMFPTGCCYFILGVRGSPLGVRSRVPGALFICVAALGDSL